jgi:CheY-like chemotaxis protein
MSGFRIVVADDDEDDFLLLKDAFDALRLKHALKHLTNGVQLLDHLSDAAARHRFPDLILLDLNMPKLNGLEALERLKGTKAYKDIPVIIYSTTDSPSHQNACNRMGAEAFVTKGSTFDDILSFVNSIDTFLNGRQAEPVRFAFNRFKRKS